jgi:hypothetical protein
MLKLLELLVLHKSFQYFFINFCFSKPLSLFLLLSVCLYISSCLSISPSFLISLTLRRLITNVKVVDFTQKLSIFLSLLLSLSLSLSLSLCFSSSHSVYLYLPLYLCSPPFLLFFTLKHDTNNAKVTGFTLKFSAFLSLLAPPLSRSLLLKIIIRTFVNTTPYTLRMT